MQMIGSCQGGSSIRVAASDTCRPLAVVLQPVSQVAAHRALEPRRASLMPGVRGIAQWGGDGLSLSWRSGVQAGTSYVNILGFLVPFSGPPLEKPLVCTCSPGTSSVLVGRERGEGDPTVWTV